MVWVSPSVELAFGWPTGQWIGADLFQRIHTDDRDRLAATLDEAASGRSAVGRYRSAPPRVVFVVEARVGPLP